MRSAIRDDCDLRKIFAIARFIRRRDMRRTIGCAAVCGAVFGCQGTTNDAAPSPIPRRLCAVRNFRIPLCASVLILTCRVKYFPTFMTPFLHFFASFSSV